jgi:hypothetical protein
LPSRDKTQGERAASRPGPLVANGSSPSTLATPGLPASRGRRARAAAPSSARVEGLVARHRCARDAEADQAGQRRGFARGVEIGRQEPEAALAEVERRLRELAREAAVAAAFGAVAGGAVVGEERAPRRGGQCEFLGEDRRHPR